MTHGAKSIAHSDQIRNGFDLNRDNLDRINRIKWMDLSILKLILEILPSHQFKAKLMRGGLAKDLNNPVNPVQHLVLFK